MKTTKNHLSIKSIIIVSALLILCSFFICLTNNLCVKAEESNEPLIMGSLNSNDYEMGYFSVSRLQYNGYVSSTITAEFDLWADEHTTYEINDDKFIISVSGYDGYLYNYTSTITATAKEGYVFDHWEVDDEVVISKYYEKNNCPKKLIAVFEEELPSYYSVMDDIYFIHEHQQESGLCWDFAFLNALEILYAKQLNEVVNYSELWVSILAHKRTKTTDLSNPGRIGDGYNEIWNTNGTYKTVGEQVLQVINQYGILFENELPFEKYYHVDDSNYQQYLNAYKNYTSTLLAPVKEVRFDNYNQYSNEENKNAIITKMKKHIRKNGNILTSINGGSRGYINNKSYYYSTAQIRNHAICIVGWDDNLVVELNGQTHQGAWIIQNSYLNNDQGLYYVLYDDVPVSVRAYGYELDESAGREFASSAYSSYNDVKINNVNALNSADSFKKCEKLVSQKNIAEYTEKDKIELTYLCVKDNILSDVKVKLLYNNSETDAFSISTTTNGRSTYYTLTSTQNLKSGVYVLKFSYYASSGTSDPMYTTSHQIYITDRVNISSCTSTNTKSVINSMDFNEKQIYSFVYSDQQRADFTIGFGRYSKIISAQNCKINNDADSTCSLGGMLIPATETSDTAGYITLTYQIKDAAGMVLYTTFDVTTINGYTFTFQVYLYILEKGVDNIVFVDYAGSYDSLSGGAFCYAIGKNFELKLSEPSRKDYKDPKLIVNGVNISANNNVVDIENLIFSEGSNFDDVNYPNTRNFDRYSAVVVFDWGDDVLSIPNAQVINLSYGQKFNEYVKQDLKGSNNYSIWINSNLSWISYDNNKKCFTGIPTEIGTFKITYNVRDNSLNIMKSVEITFVVGKGQLEFTIEDGASCYGEELNNINYTLKSGSIIESDNVKLEVICGATKTSNLGEYPITLEFQDDNLNEKYDLIFNNAKYSILINTIKCKPQNYNAEYDGKTHTIDLKLENVIEADCDISYWLDELENEQNSTKEKIYFKNCTNGTITIFYKLSKYGYETFIGSNTITITPRKLQVKVLNNTFEYDGTEKLPKIELTNIVEGEIVNYEVEGSEIEVGENYKATIRLVDGDNYVLENNEVGFAITSAALNAVEIITIVSCSVGVLTILAFMIKFIFFI